MAMAIGAPEGGDDAVISAINTTPLVDVMLVLLIIFLITSPVVLHTKHITLPNEKNQVLKTKLEDITLVIDKEGSIYWDQSPVANTDELVDRLKKVAVMVPQPEVHIRGDQQTRYEFIGKTILAAQRSGIAKVSFIIEPPSK
jgi:biopolymer transport protein ExbD